MAHSVTCSGCPECNEEFANLLRMNDKDRARWSQQQTDRLRQRHMAARHSVPEPPSLRDRLLHPTEHVLRRPNLPTTKSSSTASTGTVPPARSMADAMKGAAK